MFNRVIHVSSTMTLMNKKILFIVYSSQLQSIHLNTMITYLDIDVSGSSSVGIEPGALDSASRRPYRLRHLVPVGVDITKVQN
jgi:hypothetical protein